MLAKIGGAVLLVAGLWLGLKLLAGALSFIFSVVVVLVAVALVVGSVRIGWRLINR